MCDASNAACGGSSRAARDLFGEFGGGLKFRQKRNSLKQGQPRGGRLRIAALRFRAHEFGNEEIIVLPARFPPFLRGFLIRRQPQVPAAPRHQITRDGGFEVEPGFHV